MLMQEKNRVDLAQRGLYGAKESGGEGVKTVKLHAEKLAAKIDRLRVLTKELHKCQTALEVDRVLAKIQVLTISCCATEKASRK